MSDAEYAEMIEIPVSTCEMVNLPKRHKKKNIRKRVIDKINKSLRSEEKKRANEQVKAADALASAATGDLASAAGAENVPGGSVTIVGEKKKKGAFKFKKKFSFDIISVQVVAIFVLVVAILITNIFWEDSGINNLIKSTFGQSTTTATKDTRDYTNFSAIAPSKSEIEIEEGIMTVASMGAIYSPCDGVIEDIKENNGKWTVTINHSDVFKTIIRNVDYAYFDIGETVYQAVPVCYSAGGGSEILMFNNNSLLTNFTIVDGSIVWQS